MREKSFVRKNMKTNIKDSNDKKIKIEFLNPVSCMLNDSGGEFLSYCYHNSFPPRFKICESCLSINFHRPVPLTAWGTEIRKSKLVDGKWVPYEDEFNKIDVVNAPVTPK